jgi:hypothetical protein
MLTGPTGLPGIIAGVTGPSGINGNLVNTGPQGPTGVSGVTGPAGVAGSSINTGPVGPPAQMAILGVGEFGSNANSRAISWNGQAKTLHFEGASSSHPGLMTAWNQTIAGEKSFLHRVHLPNGFYSDGTHSFVGTRDFYVPAVSKSNIRFAFDPHFASTFFAMKGTDTVRILVPGIYLVGTETELTAPEKEFSVNVFVNGRRHETQAPQTMHQNPQHVMDFLFVRTPCSVTLRTNNPTNQAVTVSSARLFLTLISRL